MRDSTMILTSRILRYLPHSEEQEPSNMAELEATVARAEMPKELTGTDMNKKIRIFGALI